MSSSTNRLRRVEFVGKFKRLVRTAKKGTEVLFGEVDIAPSVEEALAELAAEDLHLRIICVPIDQWARAVSGIDSAREEPT